MIRANGAERATAAIRRVGLAAMLALLAGAPGAAEDALRSFPGADPDIEAVGGRYWVYPTNAGGGGASALYAWSSSDLTHWRKGEPLMRMSDVPWIGDDGAPRHSLWAPDMVAKGNRYFLYYSVGPQNPTPSRIGVARCKGPAGPCLDSGKPLITGGAGFEAIDPAVFTDPKSGVTYLYAGGSAGATLRVWVLNPDMVSIEREVEVATPPHFTEGAFMHVRNGRYYLSYSSGGWRSARYSVHYATAPTPLGPWEYKGAILTSDDRFKGPGHHAFLRDPRDGRWRIAYHRWEGQVGDGPYSGSRTITVQPVAYGPRGEIKPIRMR